MTEGHDGTETGVAVAASVDSTQINSQVLANLTMSGNKDIAAVFGNTTLVAVRGPSGDSIAVSGDECNPTATIQRGRKTRQLRAAYGGDVRSGIRVTWGLAQEGALDAQATIITLKTRAVVGEEYYHYLPIVSMLETLVYRMNLDDKFDTSFFGKQDDASRELVHKLRDALNNFREGLWGPEQAIAYTNCFSIPDRDDDGNAMVPPHCDADAWEATKVNLIALMTGCGVPLASAAKQGAFGRGNFS